MSTIVCNRCNTEIAAAARACSHCGESALGQLQFTKQRSGLDKNAAKESPWLPIAGVVGIVLVALGVAGYLWYAETHQKPIVHHISRSGAGEPVVGQARTQDELDRGLKQIFIEVLQKGDIEQTALESRIDALDLQGILTPAKLSTAQGIREGRDKLRRYDELVQQSRAASDATNAEIRRRVLILTGESHLTYGALRDYESMRARAEVNDRNGYENYRRTVATTSEALDLFQSGLGRIEFRDDQVLFRDDGDRRKFLRLIEQMDLNDRVMRDHRRASIALRGEASRRFFYPVQVK